MGIVKQYEDAMRDGLSFEEFIARKFGSGDSPSPSQKRVDDPPPEMPPYPFEHPGSNLPAIQLQMSMLVRHQAEYRAKLRQEYESAMNALDFKDFAKAYMHLGMVDVWVWFVVKYTNMLNRSKHLARNALELNSVLEEKKSNAYWGGNEFRTVWEENKSNGTDTGVGVKLAAGSHPKAAYSGDSPSPSQKRVDDPPAEMPPYPFEHPGSNLPAIQLQMSMLVRHQAEYRAKLRQEYESAMNALDFKDFAKAYMHLGMVDVWVWFVVKYTDMLNRSKHLARNAVEMNSVWEEKKSNAYWGGNEFRTVWEENI